MMVKFEIRMTKFETNSNIEARWKTSAESGLLVIIKIANLIR